MNFSPVINPRKKQIQLHPQAGICLARILKTHRDHLQARGDKQNESAVPRDEYGYLEFDVPWTMNVGYSFSYSKPGLKSSITQAVSLRGNVSLTKMIAITYTSGYDFKGKEITMTTVGIRRDLHCWEMNLNWIPVGNMKGWNFTIRAKIIGSW